MDDASGLELSLLEGMDEDLLARLYGAGVRTRRDLESRIAGDEERGSLARRIGVPEERLAALHFLNFLPPETRAERMLALERGQNKRFAAARFRPAPHAPNRRRRAPGRGRAGRRRAVHAEAGIARAAPARRAPIRWPRAWSRLEGDVARLRPLALAQSEGTPDRDARRFGAGAGMGWAARMDPRRRRATGFTSRRRRRRAPRAGGEHSSHAPRPARERAARQPRPGGARARSGGDRLVLPVAGGRDRRLGRGRRSASPAPSRPFSRARASRPDRACGARRRGMELDRAGIPRRGGVSGPRGVVAGAGERASGMVGDPGRAAPRRRSGSRRAAGPRRGLGARLLDPARGVGVRGVGRRARPRELASVSRSVSVAVSAAAARIPLRGAGAGARRGRARRSAGFSPSTTRRSGFSIGCGPTPRNSPRLRASVGCRPWRLSKRNARGTVSPRIPS